MSYSIISNMEKIFNNLFTGGKSYAILRLFISNLMSACIDYKTSKISFELISMNN